MPLPREPEHQAHPTYGLAARRALRRRAGFPAV
jgi:hypothetical protein